MENKQHVRSRSGMRWHVTFLGAARSHPLIGLWVVDAHNQPGLGPNGIRVTCTTWSWCSGALPSALQFCCALQPAPQLSAAFLSIQQQLEARAPSSPVLLLLAGWRICTKSGFHPLFSPVNSMHVQPQKGTLKWLLGTCRQHHRRVAASGPWPAPARPTHGLGVLAWEMGIMCR